MGLSSKKKLGILGLAFLFAAGAVLAQADIPLTNWTVPTYRASSASGGLTTMTDVTPGVAFVGVTPCREADTRAGSGFPAGYGPPSMAAGVPRNFDLNSQPNCTGIPAGVEAYSLNVTVTNTAGDGFIKIFPQGGAEPAVSTLNYKVGQTLANAAIVPAGTGGGVTVIAGVSATDVIIDINGYFTDEYNLGVPFLVIGQSVPGLFPGFLIAVSDASTLSTASIFSISGSTADGGSAILGWATGATGETAGVWGLNGSASNSSAGVLGVDSTGLTNAVSSFFKAGVRGESQDFYGMYGFTGNGGQAGVAGVFLTTGGFVSQRGNLGMRTATAADATTGSWAVFAEGTLGASGAKHFVEPHPTDASKVIRYTSLEGPEAGTYFRGRARFQRGMARITVPEDFRMVTDPEGLTVQITPIGGMATVGVLRVDLNEIVAQSSRDLEFSYLVQGVRATFKDLQPIVSDGVFIPESAEARIPDFLSEGQKRLLIRNGTYKEDGAVNMETAHRLGWERIWAAREHPTPQPEPAPASASGLRAIPTRPGR